MKENIWRCNFSISSQGLRIKLADGTSEKYNMLKVDDTLSVKAVGEVCSLLICSLTSLQQWSKLNSYLCSLTV